MKEWQQIQIEYYFFLSILLIFLEGKDITCVELCLWGNARFEAASHHNFCIY